MAPTQAHTDARFEEELSELKALILRMGGAVERSIEQSIRALVDRDSALAEQTIELDSSIDAMEVDVEERVTRILALHAPTARDLRFILTTLRVSNDLERIGDLSTSISERALELNREAQLKPFIDLPKMAEMVQKMVREALDAFVREQELGRLLTVAEDGLPHLGLYPFAYDGSAVEIHLNRNDE
jgi:phosphate transport system protein